MHVLDTDVLIDFLMKREPTTSFLAGLRDEGVPLATTSINAGELLRGARGRPGALAKATKLLSAFTEVPFGPRAARRFGEIMDALDRVGAPVSTSDGLIAAATLEAGGILVTRNVRDFGRIAGLEVVRPGVSLQD